MNVRFFLRKKFPAYFSIEQIFIALAHHINSQPVLHADVDILEAPFYLGLANFFKNIVYVRQNQAAVNHITGDIHYAILGCSKRNLNVLTIHDCVLLERHSKWNIRYWIFRLLWFELPMRKADLITVISEKTKKDLLAKLNYGEKKLRVVRNFVNPAFTHQPKIFNKEKPVLLFIGSTENKNLDRILQAIDGIPCRLDIVGQLSAAQQTFITEKNIDIDISFGISLEELVKKYVAADMVLFPSLYEGFGMLIIEANAVGRPVITSNFSPMLEVAGKAAMLVDPFDVYSIRDGIIKVIDDDKFREALITEGLVNAQRYSLEKVAATYVELYREFLTP